MSESNGADSPNGSAPEITHVHDVEEASGTSSPGHYVQKWKPSHDRIVALHLAGYKNVTIAAIIGCTDKHVGRVILDPRAQKAIKKLQKRLFSAFQGRIEDKLITLGEAAVDNLAETVHAQLGSDAVGSRAKKHQDQISESVLDRLGFGKKNGERGNEGNIQLSDEASQRLVQALEGSDKARKMWEKDEEVEEADYEIVEDD